MKNPKLYIISTDKVSDYPEEYFKAYFPKRYEKSKEYHREGDALRSLCAAVLLKDVLGIKEKDLLYNKYGKPFSDKCRYCFNISHSGKYCVLAVFDSDVGVDIELRREIDKKSVKRVLTDEEYAFAADDLMLRFFDIWTTKESIYKFLGIGVGTEITKLDVLPMLENGTMLYDGIKLYGKNISLKNYSISLCSDREFNVVDLEYL